MPIRLIALALCVLGLAACRGEPPAATGDPVPDHEPAAAAAPPAAASDDDAPAGPGVDPAAGGGAGMPGPGTIRFDGFGPAAFGADAEAVRMAWGNELGTVGPVPAEACHYLFPQPMPADGYRIAFMLEGGRFVRLDVAAADIVAPGGGRVGMRAEEIEALYPDRVERRPHKYVDGGQYLRIAGDGGVLLFATGADGRVGEWRVGVPPQVDYVEGCS